MVSIVPFEAIRYNPEKITDLSRVIAPPYDQILPEAQEKLYQQHPYNFVRLILGRTSANDSEKSNRYTRAAGDLEQWIKEKILIKENEPFFFLYEQRFSFNKRKTLSRLGLVGLLELEPLGKNVFPHERTFPKPKEDRLSLMKACKANLEHVFFLYDDPKHIIKKSLQAVQKQKPLFSCNDTQETRHTLWKITSPQKIKAIQKFLTGKTLLIADGHHRYETSLTYQKEMKDIWCSSTSNEAPFNYRLGTLVSLQDPGLLILPAHRVLRKSSPQYLEILEKRILELFAVKEFPNLRTLQEKLRGEKHAWGWITLNRFRLIQLKKSFNLAKTFPKISPRLRSLDVFLLQNLIFDNLLSLPHDTMDQMVSYVRWAEDANKLVQSGSHLTAFLLNPAKPSDVKKIALAGEKMPHKSTDFYPKLWSGLLFYKMEM